MGRTRLNAVYSYYDDTGAAKFRCKIGQCVYVIKCSGSPSNLVNHLRTHKNEYSEYAKGKNETEQKEAAERQRRNEKEQMTQVNITEHVTVKSRFQLGTSHPRQKQFVRNLVLCAAQSSQSVNFYTSPNLPN